MFLYRKLIYIGLLLFLGLGVVLGLSYFKIEDLSFFSRGSLLTNQDNSFIVTLGKAGFEPQEITIKKGETVTFKTEREVPFWPASDIHPNHTIYPQFDVREPVLPDQTWSFKFDKPGRWTYHDHLSSLDEGVIFVLGEDVDRVNFKDECERKDSNNIQCWQKAILTTLENDGVAAAFEVLAGLYSKYPAFAGACHGNAHDIGEEAYRKFARGEDFSLTPKASYCGYGFYHGFMETLLHTSGELEEAREFCAYVDEKLKEINRGAWIACYHGIGHGVTDGSDPRAWGSAITMAAPGLELCEVVALTEFKKNLCASGVFNGLAIAYQIPQYELEIKNNNPYWICDQYDKTYIREPCYDQMNTLAIQLGEGDFSKSVDFVKNIQDPDYAWHAMHGLSSATASFRTGGDYTDIISTCKTLNNRLREVCFGAFVGGIIEHGPPEREYLVALDFCKTSGITASDASACYQAVQGYSWHRYSLEKYEEVCKLIEKEHEKIC